MPPMFEKFDTNQDGKLSQDEVRLGVDKAFTEADTNKDGSISKEEMRAHHQAMHDKRGSPMSARWKAADKDGDGALSRAEVDAAGMKMLSRDFDSLDKNHDGKLMPDEIRDGMMTRRQGGAPTPAPSPAPTSPAK
jgi:Ca2+-binding EF-hand superfamily protein